MEHQIYEKGTSHEEIEHYDVVILGAGPSGLTSAIYAGRYNMKTLVIANVIGGTANLAGEIENWPGFIGSGIELMQNFKSQVEKFGAKFLESEVENVEKDSNGFVLHLFGKEIHSKTLIVALGTEHRKLDIKGEKEFMGAGVSYCATCDGNFFRGKTVVVVGGADSAAKAALYLSNICKKVHIIYRRHEMRCEPISFSRICEKENIEIHYYTQPQEILGNGKVEGIKIKTSFPEKETVETTLDVDGVFIEIGATPATDVIKNLGLEIENGYITTNKEMKTNISGVFAAGDVTNNSLKQVVTAAGEGAVAAKSAHDFLMKN